MPSLVEEDDNVKILQTEGQRDRRTIGTFGRMTYNKLSEKIRIKVRILFSIRKMKFREDICERKSTFSIDFLRMKHQMFFSIIHIGLKSN